MHILLAGAQFMSWARPQLALQGWQISEYCSYLGRSRIQAALLGWDQYFNQNGAAYYHEITVISSLPLTGTKNLLNIFSHCVSQTNSNFTVTYFYNVAWLFGVSFMCVILCLFRGYGFVKFTDELEQKRALTECQGAVGLGSKPVRLSVAIPKAWVEEQLDIFMKNHMWF